MRIRQISINNLFGIFNHTIPLNLDERITIIHGPNGYGKTVILKIIDAIFNSKYSEIFKIPFADLKIDFDDDSILIVKKDVQSKLIRVAMIDENLEQKTVEDIKLIFLYKKKGNRQFLKYEVSSLKSRHPGRDIRSLIDNIPFITRLSYNTWSDDRTDDIYSTNEVIERFGNYIPTHLIDIEKEKDWFIELKKSVGIRFIETQRLFTFKGNRKRRESEERSIESVLNYSKDLVDRIQQNLTLYANNSQTLDRTFPQRLLTGEESQGMTKEELKSNLNELEKKRSHLFELGLLDKQEEEIDFGELESKFTETNRRVLSVYIKDVKAKLSVFDDLSNKIDILLLMIKSKFRYKKMVINKKEGFVFYTDNNEKLSPASLSSGEQHELILLNELLFNVKPNSLILIDEPELSLHIIWQQQFLTDLLKIIDLVQFDVLIATHAPEIINDKSDLTVQLKGP
jgi:predicted ATP-binding protein involved in virulence